MRPLSKILLKRKTWLAITFLVCTLVAFNGWRYASSNRFYDTFMGLAILFLSLAYWESNKKDLESRAVGELISLLSLQNVADELFFDPMSAGLNEYVFGGVLIVWTIFKIKQWKASGKA